MNCKFCGAHLPEDAETCPGCGAPVGSEHEEEKHSAQWQCDSASLTEEEIERKLEQEETERRAAKQRRKKKGHGFLLTLLGIIIGGILVAAVLYGAGADLKPRKNDIFRKDTYTVDGETAEKNQDQVVAVLGDRELTNSELQVFYEMAKGNFLSYYGAYAAQLGLDPSKPLDQQVQDPDTGMTWQQYFLDNSLQTWQRYAVLSMLAEKENFKTSDTTLEQIKNTEQELQTMAANAGFSSLQDMITKDLGTGVTEEAYFKYLRTYYEALDYYDHVFESLKPTDEEIEKYYAENEAIFTKDQADKSAGSYVDVRHILIVPKDGTEGENGKMEYTEENWAAALKAAEDALNDWKNGEATEQAFADLAGKLSEDPGSRQNGGLYTQVVKGKMVKPFEDWCFEDGRKAGDTGIVKTEFGYHIMYFVDSQEIWHNEAMGRIITERTDKFIDEGMEQFPMKVNYKKITLGVREQAQVPEVTAPEITVAPETTEPSEATAAPETTGVPETTAQ